MKQKFLNLVISAFCSIVFLPACRSASENLIEAKETERSDAGKISTEAKIEVTQSETDSLQKMQRDFLDSWEDFKKESEAKIIKNEKDLVSLSASIVNREPDMRIAYRKVVADLRVKNENLKERLAGFADTRQEYLNAFRLKFNNDMNAVTKSLDNIK